MNALRSRVTRGFTLIELVIVVVIIGIIAAIAIPRLSRGAEGAADAKLRGDLNVLRNAIDLFATEHGGDYPSATEATFITQLTEKSNVNGTTTAPPAVIYGPYIRAIPTLSVGTNKGNVGINIAILGAAGKAWHYTAASGEIKANLAVGEKDDAGVIYSEY